MYVENIGGVANTVNTVAASPVRQTTESEPDAKASSSAKTSADASEVATDGTTQSSQGDTSIISSTAGSESNLSAEEKAAQNRDKIRKAIEKMNAQLPNSEVKFGIHEKTDRVTIKLVDKDTKEVIKEFPPEKTLDMIAKCMELAGVLVDEKL